jgi:hypothetical protein
MHWSGSSNGQLSIQWENLGAFLEYVNGTIAPAAAKYGFKLTLEPLPKDEPQVGRL